MIRGATLLACPSGALWWPSERLLCVADLHFGKSGRLARRGGPLLPPYETWATLDRLGAEIAALDPARVVCLGDSFDDLAAASALDPGDTTRLLALMAGRDWTWITGNHDPGPVDLPGTHLFALARGPLVFRHAAAPGHEPGEVTGHYHPKIRLVARGRTLTRPCFVHDTHRLVLPAFGTYTGGLFADHPVLQGLFKPGAQAILTGEPCLAIPLSGR